MRQGFAAAPLPWGWSQLWALTHVSNTSKGFLHVLRMCPESRSLGVVGLFIWQLKAPKWLTFLRHVPIRPIAGDREYIKHTVLLAVS